MFPVEWIDEIGRDSRCTVVTVGNLFWLGWKLRMKGLEGMVGVEEEMIVDLRFQQKQIQDQDDGGLFDVGISESLATRLCCSCMVRFQGRRWCRK